MKQYTKTADKNWYKQRLIRSMFFIMSAFVVLIIRLFYLQILEGEEFRRLSENQCIRLQSIDPPRGLIYDCNGNLLVDNRPSFDLSIILKDAGSVERTIQKLSGYINVPDSYLMSKIEANKRRASYKPILLKQDIGRDTLASVEVHKFDLPGVYVNVRQKRYYIQNQSAAHLTGYLGEINSGELESERYSGYRAGDIVGKFGIEKSAEQFLRGERGGRQVEVDAKGRVVRVLKTVDAKPGHNIYLTIDRKLQKKAESLIEGIAASVVVMEPLTGHIFAMASNPSFDPNAFIGGISHEEWNQLISHPFRPMENKAIQGEYPPASTYKIVTAIAGLEEGVINKNTTYYCPGYHKFGDRIFRCWKKSGHGTCNVVRAIALSCDVFFYQVGQRLGVDRLAKYANACGLGARTGINLDHEARGLVPSSGWKKKRMGVPWHKGETLSVAIGQGYNVATPLQMAVLISAVGNGGTLYKPLILKKAETVEGEIVYEGKPQEIGRLPASNRTLSIVRKGLRDVVSTRGTALVAKVKGLEISGKTGTAQVASRRTGDSGRKKKPPHLKAHAWFVAYAEPDDPKVAVSVIVEHGEHGSGSASPIARELIKAFMMRNTAKQSYTQNPEDIGGQPDA
ncbi:penicillin-binding protein 2 [Desulfococcaceae bacterium HSG8]|nr:penicillin-binding protein 2 [Desulfococcaceae bacterium HSG8]